MRGGIVDGADESPLPESAETYVSSGPMEFSWEKARKDAEGNAPPRFIHKLPRGSLPCEEPSPEVFFCTSPEEISRSMAFQLPSLPDGFPTPSPASITDAVDMLMRYPSAAAVVQLMRPGRLGVSFKNYISPAREFMSEKPTIEFRQLSATFNADAACAWIGVVAQLCRVAIDWPWEDFNTLLRRCALGETWPDAYDVFDLLVDIGCADQAVLIQDMVIDGQASSPFARLNAPDDGRKQQLGTGDADPSSRPFETDLP